MKLDKKLILSMENLEYKSEKTMTNSSIEDIKKNLDILPIVLKWFQSINIEKLSINDNIVKIVLDEDILSVENKFFLLDSKIKDAVFRLKILLLDLTKRELLINLSPRFIHLFVCKCFRHFHIFVQNCIFFDGHRIFSLSEFRSKI